VCCHIHGFQPYFYAAMPGNFAPDDVEAFRKALNVRARARASP
jgi:DNA polymerase delta subunit 1